MIKAEILTVAGPYLVPLPGAANVMEGTDRITEAVKAMRDYGGYLILNPNVDQLEVLKIEEKANPILHIRVFDEALQLEGGQDDDTELPALRNFRAKTQYLGAPVIITGRLYEATYEGHPHYYYLPVRVNGKPWDVRLTDTSLGDALRKAIHEEGMPESEYDIVLPIPELDTLLDTAQDEYLMDYVKEAEKERRPKVLKPTAKAAFEFAPGKFRGAGE